MIKAPQEKIGSFYLGARYDIASKTLSNETINYDARDLCTHAVCVGMTGSGKTGLCIGLLEEAAMDKVPAIIIDPKGDMTNLLLQFPDLDTASFAKWINPDDAARKGLAPEEYAAATAVKWKNGLAEWGQGPERIKALNNNVEYTIYTPGSDAGQPINIMGSLAAPKGDFEADAETHRERIQGTVAALLGMIGNTEDPLRSREGILLSTLFEHYWKQNQDLDLTKLIRGIQDPPVKQLGVFDVDTFFPQKDRFNLAMDFNTLVASPSFQYWLKGDPLDIDKIYFTADGKPKHSIFFIAHLSDSERMFFVTLLLNSLVSWMRRQSGTNSLRSLLYFDEIFGFFPPTSNPSSKKPLLTILKQARAFGLGSILVTQNPVDIDYKGLSNAGTWFIGKLQTDNDKQRVLDGLKGAIAESGSSSSVDFDQVITGLSSRVFLMHNVHDAEPVVYHTRWAMSYLRGPLTRPQVKELMQSKKTEVKAEPALVGAAAVSEAPAAVSAAVATPPTIDPKIMQRFFGVWKTQSQAKAEMGINEDLKVVYEPNLLAAAKVRFYDADRGVDEIKEIAILSNAPDDFGRSDWDNAAPLKDWDRSLLSDPENPGGVEVAYLSVPDTLNSTKEMNAAEKDFSDWLYQNQKISLKQHKKLKLKQNGDESDEDFHSRVQQLAREERDEEMDEMKEKFEKKLDRVAEKIRKEEQDLEQAQQEVQDRKRSEMVGMAETAFGMLFGRKRSLSGMQSKSRMKRKAKDKVQESREDLEALDEDYGKLEEELQENLDELTEKWDTITEGVTAKEVKPRRTDIKVESVLLAWNPFWVSPSGKRTTARG